MRLIGLLAVLFYSQISYSASTLISDYIFEWSEHKDNKIAIKVKHRSGKVLFETAEEKSFIELYKRNSAVEETSGFFKVHHFPPKIVCDSSSLDKVTAETNRIHFDLSVFGENCFANVRLSFTVNTEDEVDLLTVHLIAPSPLF